MALILKSVLKLCYSSSTMYSSAATLPTFSVPKSDTFTCDTISSAMHIVVGVCILDKCDSKSRYWRTQFPCGGGILMLTFLFSKEIVLLVLDADIRY